MAIPKRVVRFLRLRPQLVISNLFVSHSDSPAAEDASSASENRSLEGSVIDWDSSPRSTIYADE